MQGEVELMCQEGCSLYVRKMAKITSEERQTNVTVCLHDAVLTECLVAANLAVLRPWARPSYAKVKHKVPRFTARFTVPHNHDDRYDKIRSRRSS